jgi:site-specific recombinase XerD
MNMAISALKFFYSVLLKKDLMQEHRRPRGDKRLPVVFAKDELKQLFSAVDNPKHRLLLMLAYSSGLRVSEVVNLKREDIDVSRKTLLVRAAKGRKDRYTVLSTRAALALGNYTAVFPVSSWLFPGIPAARHLSIRSAQHIFEQALQKAGILKNASIHSLRHSFAAHLMESGTSLRYIKDLLGHTSIKTTERYIHVASPALLTIISPLDTII